MTNPSKILHIDVRIVFQNSEVITSDKNVFKVSSNLGKTNDKSSDTARICHIVIQNTIEMHT